MESSLPSGQSFFFIDLFVLEKLFLKVDDMEKKYKLVETFLYNA